MLNSFLQFSIEKLSDYGLYRLQFSPYLLGA